MTEIVRCACGATENLRELDLPSTWGIEFICPACDAEYDGE